MFYLLAFLNSEACSRILKVINHTTNNSANYLKKLPIIINENYFEEVNELVRGILNGREVEKALERIDEIFNSVYQVD